MFKEVNDIPVGSHMEKDEFSDSFLRNWCGECENGKIENTEETDLPRCPMEGSGGRWEGERGESDWIPDDEYIPGDRNGTNPEGKTWGEIKEEYGFEEIPFENGRPDFSEVSADEVKIEDFSCDRVSNFQSADEKLADIRECEPEDIEAWRKENRYTWHELEDCATMQLVPTEVHGNIPHEGGYAKAKAEMQM